MAARAVRGFHSLLILCNYDVSCRPTPFYKCLFSLQVNYNDLSEPFDAVYLLRLNHFFLLLNQINQNLVILSTAGHVASLRTLFLEETSALQWNVLLKEGLGRGPS